jgi:hypothetical protein
LLVISINKSTCAQDRNRNREREREREDGREGFKRAWYELLMIETWKMYTHIIGVDDELWDFNDEGVIFDDMDEEGVINLKENFTLK